MRRCSFSLLIGTILFLLCPRVGLAEQGPALLERGVTAYDDLRIEDSLRLLEQAERAGGLGDQLARLHLYRGLCRGSLGESAAADAAFRLSLALDETIELPPDQSPVVVNRFEELRQLSDGGGRDDVQDVQDPPPIEPDPDPDDGSTPPPPPPQQPHQEPRPMILTWVFLGLTAATFAGGATTLILSQVTRAKAQNDEHSQEEANDMLDLYRLETRITFALLSASATLGLCTLIAWLGERSRRPATEARRSRRVALLPSLNGLSLVF